MQFKIKPYTARNGRNYVKELLDSLEKANYSLYGAAIAKIDLITDSEYHRPPTCRSLGQGLWEIKIQSGSSICRINWCFSKGRKIYLLNGCSNKKEQNREIRNARKLKAELNR